MDHQNDFLQPLLDMMAKRLDTLEQKIDANTVTTNQTLEQAKYTNGRVTRAEKAIAKLEQGRGKKLSLDFSPNVIYLVALGAVILLAIIATVLHVQLGGIL